MREIRPSGSVRGVRSNPYPYRDPTPPDAVGGAKNVAPEKRLREHETAWATLPASDPRGYWGSDTAAQSTAITSANRRRSALPSPPPSGRQSEDEPGRERPLHRRPIPPAIGTASVAQERQPPRLKAARPNPRRSRENPVPCPTRVGTRLPSVKAPALAELGRAQTMWLHWRNAGPPARNPTFTFALLPVLSKQQGRPLCKIPAPVFYVR